MMMSCTRYYQRFIIICSVLHHSIENQKAKGGCYIFNIQNVSLAKYLYSNIDDVTAYRQEGGIL